MSPDYALTNWISSNYFCYVMLDPSASPKEVAGNFDAHFDYSKQYGDMAKDIHAELVPLTDIYYMNEDSSGSLVKSGSAEKTRLSWRVSTSRILVPLWRLCASRVSTRKKCWGVLPAYYVLPCYLRPWALACLLSFVLCLSFGD